MTSEIALRYAEGLFALVRENDAVRPIKAEAEELTAIADANPELQAFFASVKISDEEKKDFIEAVFGGDFNRWLVNYMKLLIDKDRISLLRESLEGFVDLCNEELGIQKACVYSAHALAAEDLDRIRETLALKSGKEVILENKIDASLLAGIKVVMGNNVTDTTLKSRMEEMKRTLLKGGQA